MSATAIEGQINAGQKEVGAAGTGFNFFLYEEDAKKRPTVATILQKVHGNKISPLETSTSTEPGIVPPDGPTEKPKIKANLGTFNGVYLPVIEATFGVLFFVRFSWIAGTAGVVESFFIGLLCCLAGFLTSISLSAVATNGYVPSGGPYFLISRNLGSEVGGAVGLLFAIGLCLIPALDITGAVEIFIMYIYPAAKIFDRIDNCSRLYGTIWLVIVGAIVMGGIRVVNKFALPCVLVVVASVFLIFAGIFINVSGTDRVKFCVIGDRTVNLVEYMHANPKAPRPQCNATDLARIFCSPNYTASFENCDPYFAAHAQAGNIELRNAIKGLASGSISLNVHSKYLAEGQVISYDPTDKEKPHGRGKYYLTSELATSFLIMIAVFFPSTVDIMSGSNRSGDLKDASRSIPIGTLCATVTVSVIYLVGMILFTACVDPMFLRDKFGQSAGGKLLVAEISITPPLVVLIGVLMSTFGASLQNLTGGPRVLQAIAQDDIIPALRPFAMSNKIGEPMYAQFLAFAICEVGILIGTLESITALLAQFFLMCYLAVNTACALQSLLKAPGWRPRYKYYHWLTALAGAGLCIAIMFMCQWYYAIVTVVAGVVIYKYIEFRGAEKEWGDGIRGLGLSAAIYSLLRLEDSHVHTKNWRPQLLILLNMTDNGEISHPKLLAFSSQLKAGKGLTVLASVFEGNLNDHSEIVQQRKETLRKARTEFKIRGFCEVLTSKTVNDGIAALIQACGLGGLKHNTVAMAWPTLWASGTDSVSTNLFIETIKLCSSARLAVLVLKNVDNFPLSSERIAGTIDVWWIVDDGGLLLLLPFLLRQKRTWRKCELRIFTVAQMEDNSVKMRQDLKEFLYQLRIDAKVEVVEMTDSDISDYVYERTLRMEQRSHLLREMHLSEKERLHEVQSIVDFHHLVARKDSVRFKVSRAASADFGLQFKSSVAHENEEPPFKKRPSSPNLESLSNVIFHRRKHSPATDKRVSIAPSEDHSNTPSHQDEAISRANSAEPEAEPEAEVQLPDSYFDFVKKVRFAEPTEIEVDNPTPRMRRNVDSLLDERMHNLKDSNDLDERMRHLDAQSVRRMHTAMKLNEMIRSRSSEAQLVIINLPGPPENVADESAYMEFVDVSTEGLNRVLMVRGGGTEVVTMFT